MHQHHQKAIEIFLERYKKDETILAILMAGSLAHGFATANSDIDLLIIVDENEFQKRKKDRKLAFSLWDICKYEGGYVDCKVVDIAMLEKIAERGSDPARYAFKDNQILYSKIDNLEELLEKIQRYPVEDMDERRRRFASQMLAWKWYYSEGVKKQNSYIKCLAVQKLVLFSVRIILNENQLLYPFHKWMLKVLETASAKPENILEKINILIENNSIEYVEKYAAEIFEFIGFTEKTVDWPNYFLRDSEQNWIEHEAPVDDI